MLDLLVFSHPTVLLTAFNSIHVNTIANSFMFADCPDYEFISLKHVYIPYFIPIQYTGK